MSDMQSEEIQGRTWAFGRPVTCRLGPDGLEIRRGSEATRVGYDEVAAIRVDSTKPGREVFSLHSAWGGTTTIRMRPRSGAGAQVEAFTKSLVARVARAAPETTFVLGPSRSQWVAAWIGLVASGAIIIAVLWTFFAGGPFAPTLVPLAIALVNLSVVLPILRAGRPRALTVAEAAPLVT